MDNVWDSKALLWLKFEDKSAGVDQTNTNSHAYADMKGC